MWSYKVHNHIACELVAKVSHICVNIAIVEYAIERDLGSLL